MISSEAKGGVWPRQRPVRLTCKGAFKYVDGDIGAISLKREGLPFASQAASCLFSKFVEHCVLRASVRCVLPLKQVSRQKVE
jgi:hypothetical protein